METSPDEALIEFPTEINPAQIENQVAQAESLSLDRLHKTLNLLREGNTVPFIARYRKEVTGAMDESKIRDIHKTYSTLVNLEERKLSVLKLINDQGKLTEALRDRILKAEILQEVEDLYLPYKKKIKTLGAKAREKGLGPLAELIMAGGIDGDPETLAETYINEEKGVKNIKDALSGAVDIIAEDTSSDVDARQFVREVVYRRGIVKTKVDEDIASGKKKPDIEDGKKPVDPSTFQDYFDFSLQGTMLQNHQVLALSRADKLGIIDFSVEAPDEELIRELKKKFIGKQTSKTNNMIEYFEKGVEAGYKRYIVRSIKREVWNGFREKAEEHAIKVFATNLKNLLMTPPLKNRAIIGIDPGFRTGCKVAVIDQYGKYLANDVIYPHQPKNRVAETERILIELVKKYKAYTFAIGNGTASRETETVVANIMKRHKSKSMPLEYAMVSEAGASVYSASELAIEEFPDLDLTVRGAISIARRLQDPLSELIKIDPKSIGVGMYQHDVNQVELKHELANVIEDCVNGVGVDLNTASSKLLSHVSGITKRVGKAIVKQREAKGPFTSRNAIQKVRGLGPKAYEQCAGFLKIRDAENSLDRTFIHPESYDLTEKILSEIDLIPSDLIDPKKQEKVKTKFGTLRINSLVRKYGVERDKIRYLIDQLMKPTLDPRDALDAPILRQDVLSIEDLKEGMIVKGTVRNVVDFGAFCDIGVKYDGLVHKSQIANQFVQNPHDFLKVGEVYDFMIIGVDLGRKRIQLSIKQVKQS